MGNFEKQLRRVEAVVGLVSLATIILLVFLSAILRKINHPIVWSTNLAQLLFVWTAFIGADLAFQQHRHIGVDVILRRLPPPVQRAIITIMYLLIIGFLVPIGSAGAYLGIMNSSRLYSSLQISYSWATFSVPVGCLLMTRTAVIHLFQHLRNRQPEPGTAADAVGGAQ